MTIVKLKVDHIKAITKLAAQLGYTATVPEMRKRISRIIKDKHHHMVVAIEGKEILGWIHLELIHSLLYEPRVEIRALVVDEGFRGKGVGKSLTNYAQGWAKKKKVKRIFLRTNIKREDAHRFYEREGFERTKTSYKYERRP